MEQTWKHFGCFWYCRGWITTQLYRGLLISCWWMLLKRDWVQRTCPGLPRDNIMKLRLKKGTKSSSLTSSSMRLSKETKSLTLALPVASVLLVFCFFTKVASFSESFWNWKNLPSSVFLLYLKVPAHGTVPRYDRLIPNFQHVRPKRSHAKRPLGLSHLFRLKVSR